MFESCVSSEEGTEIQKSSPYPEKVEYFPPESNPMVSLMDSTEARITSKYSRPEQQVEIRLFLSREDFAPRLTFSLMLCLRQLCSVWLIFLEFRQFRRLCLRTNASAMEDID
jgi:hypothetical protein